MNTPSSEVLSTRCLNRVFDRTTSTYKFYWFLAILDLVVKEGKTRFHIWDIAILMVAKAWCPVACLHLSLGKCDSLWLAIMDLQAERKIPYDVQEQKLLQMLDGLFDNQDIRKRFKFLENNVPYRFLSPWINTSNNAEMLARSQTFENGCLYQLERRHGYLWVELNLDWLEYLQVNYNLLRSFAFWHLTEFLQARNPEVDNLPVKLIKASGRYPFVQK